MIMENHIVWRSREDHSPLVTLVLETNKVLVHPYSVTKAQLGELAAAALQCEEILSNRPPAPPAESEGGA